MDFNGNVLVTNEDGAPLAIGCADALAKSLPAYGAQPLTKAHVDAYTRSDGTVVQAHEDNRQAATVMAPKAGRGGVFHHLSAVHGAKKANEIWHHANAHMQQHHGMSPQESRSFLESHHGHAMLSDVSRHVDRGQDVASHEPHEHLRGQINQHVSNFHEHRELDKKARKEGALGQANSRRLDAHDSRAEDHERDKRDNSIQQAYRSGV